MTIVTRHPGTGWDTTLPDLPKDPLTLAYPIRNDWDMSKLTGAEGSTVLSVTDSVAGVVISGSVGGTLRAVGSAGLSKYLQFVGSTVGASLVSPNSLTGTQTVLVIARPMVGDIVPGPAPIFSINSTTVVAQGPGQGDDDVAGVFDASTDTPANVPYATPALRGKWHVYGIVKPTTGTAAKLSVDTTQVDYTAPQAGGLSTLSIAVGYSQRRKLQVTRALTFTAALTDAELDTAYAAIKAYYYDLDWAV